LEFAQALAAKDTERLRELLHPAIEFRGLTPSRSWEADDREAVLAVLLGEWFEDTDEIEAVEQLDGDAFSDRERESGLPVPRQQPGRPVPRRAAGVPVRA
jgi:hypothetical protein